MDVKIKEIKEIGVIKKYNEKRQEDINTNAVDLLQDLDIKIEHYINLLSLVIEWIDEQHRADIQDIYSCLDLVTQKEKYNSLLRTLKENLENTRNDIQTITY